MICSIAFFNYSGVSVTKEMSATTRMVLDSVRTLTIWVYGMLVGWETFFYLQVVGFILLLTGTFVYNNIIVTPILNHFGLIPVISSYMHILMAAERKGRTADALVERRSLVRARIFYIDVFDWFKNKN
jgi:hypothetical protein